MKANLLVPTALFIATVSVVAYDRANWRHWSDFDADGLDTRSELLESSGCAEENAVCVCPYSGKLLFPGSIHVDHVISLKEAHEAGGWSWSKKKKEEFANDEENLLLVDGITNIRKGAKGESEWLPRERAYWPEYFDKRNKIRKKYNLWVKPEDVIAMLEKTREMSLSE